MTIAFDNSNTLLSAGFAAGASYTFNLTIGSLTSGIVILGAALWQDVAGTGTISACSVNGVAATSAKVLTNGAMRAELWYVKLPAPGTYTVSFTVSGNTDARKFFAASFSGVDQTTPIDASNSAATASGAPSVSVTTVTANAWLVDCVSKFGTTALTASAGQTVILNSSTSSTTGAGTRKGPVASPGATTMSYTGSSANDCAHVAIALRPDATAGTPPPGGSTNTTNFFQVL